MNWLQNFSNLLTLNVSSSVHLIAVPIPYLENPYGIINIGNVHSYHNSPLSNSTVQLAFPIDFPGFTTASYIPNLGQQISNATLNHKGKKKVKMYNGGFSHWPGRAQMSEDIFIFEKWFFGISGGVMVESGALNGKTFSTTMFFETFANWTSVHIEADLKNYRSLVKNRPKSINVNSALCSKSGLVHFLQGKGPTSGIFEYMSNPYLQTFFPQLVTKNRTDALREATEIPCIPIKHIFAALKLTHIDVWVLDVEGSELDVLHGFDFEVVSINLVVMECDGTDKKKDKEKVHLLQKNKFRCEIIYKTCFCPYKMYAPSKGHLWNNIPIISMTSNFPSIMLNGTKRKIINSNKTAALQKYQEVRGVPLVQVSDIYWNHLPSGADVSI